MPQLHPRRIPLMAIAMAALIAAIWGGLIRVGLPLPGAATPLPPGHGPLMVGGFLGTLIGLERAVAMRHWAAFSAPALAAIGVILVLAGLDLPGGAVLITLASLALLIVTGEFVRRHGQLYLTIMTLGVACWLAGNLLWLAGRPLFEVAWFWAGFLIFTIAGERLELSRVLRMTPRKQALLLAASGLVLTGLVAALARPDGGVRILGLGLMALAAWLFRYDLARRSARAEGLTRFIGICLLSGYGWLAIGGLLALTFGQASAGPLYDAQLHAVFLGFAFSMIFGHAPVIFPAVLGLPVGYRPAFYIHLIVLHAALALRVTGDVFGWLPARQWGALGNAVAILLFFALTVYSVIANLRSTKV